MKRGLRPHSSSQLHFLWKKKLENLFYFLTKNGQPISGQDKTDLTGKSLTTSGQF